MLQKAFWLAKKEMKHNLGAIDFFVFIFLWLGYALALGGGNPFIEYGTSGKVLHITPFVLGGVFIVGRAIFGLYSDHSVVEWSFLLVKNYGSILAVISLIIGILGCLFWNQLLTYRLQNRDYM